VESIEGYEESRSAEAAAVAVWGQMWDAINGMGDRAPTRFDDIVEIAVALADREMGGTMPGDGPEFPDDLTLKLVNAIFALASKEGHP
jgi:hypothetical protein